MGKIIISIIFVMLLSSIASAEIIINQQPNEIYNLGDTITTPVTIKASNDISGSFQMNLLCGGHDINFYRNGIRLFYGEEEKMYPSLVLTQEVIGEVIGDCKIKASLIGEEAVLTNEFRISDLIIIEIKTKKTEFIPGESIFIEGYATKENKKEVNGFMDLQIISSDGKGTNHFGTINNGFFSVNISLAEDSKAGDYIIKLNAYERNFLGETTNTGYAEHSIYVIQVPTSLEIVFDKKEVEPGTDLKVKTIVHDQTGEKIEGGSAIIKIKDKKGLILEQAEKQTDEFLEFPIMYNEPSAEWTVTANSKGLEAEASFTIKEKKEVNVEIINKTLTITNVGNVPYNETVLIKIGNESITLNVNLEVDGSQKYKLSAPDGEYQVEVVADGESYITENVILTGKIVDIKEAEGVLTLVRYPFVWVFIIFVLGFVAFIVFKKGYKRSFFGYIHSKKGGLKKAVPLRKKSLINTTNKAELSLSLKGDKQNISLICLKIKNLAEIETKKGNAIETLQKIVDISEEKKSAIYENQDNLFFILAPVKTKTFKNEKTAIELAKKIESILTEHNRLSNQKIAYGVSLNYGTIVAQKEANILKFMSMGTLITTAKKIASLSEKEILLGEKIKEKLVSEIKTEKQTKGNVSFYTIKGIKQDKEENKKFIKNFLDRIEGKK